MTWLVAHERDLADYLQAFPVLGFRMMRRYSYSSKQDFSINRWSCVGEAAVFADPLYSPKTDMIGVGNNITIEMVGESDYVLSADEKTSIPARNRTHPTSPPQTDQPARVEHEYDRGGARLTGRLGRSLGPSLLPLRTHHRHRTLRPSRRTGHGHRTQRPRPPRLPGGRQRLIPPRPSIRPTDPQPVAYPPSSTSPSTPPGSTTSRSTSRSSNATSSPPTTTPTSPTSKAHSAPSKTTTKHIAIPFQRKFTKQDLHALLARTHHPRHATHAA